MQSGSEGNWRCLCGAENSVGNTPPVETERSFFVIRKQYVNAQKPRKVNWGKLGFTSLSYVYGEIKL